jgi:hypothetical protein
MASSEVSVDIGNRDGVGTDERIVSAFDGLQEEIRNGSAIRKSNCLIALLATLE